ncbi:hypothetical protein Hdeb2414_s0023g00634901 [Helianthus debilis subsp. tardiflorus]
MTVIKHAQHYPINPARVWWWGVGRWAGLWRRMLKLRQWLLQWRWLSCAKSVYDDASLDLPIYGSG